MSRAVIDKQRHSKLIPIMANNGILPGAVQINRLKKFYENSEEIQMNEMQPKENEYVFEM